MNREVTLYQWIGVGVTNSGDGLQNFFIALNPWKQRPSAFSTIQSTILTTSGLYLAIMSTMFSLTSVYTAGVAILTIEGGVQVLRIKIIFVHIVPSLSIS